MSREAKIATITLPQNQIDKVEHVVTEGGRYWKMEGNNLTLYSDEG
jgi:hypothetical protein